MTDLMSSNIRIRTDAKGATAIVILLLESDMGMDQDGGSQGGIQHRVKRSGSERRHSKGYQSHGDDSKDPLRL